MKRAIAVALAVVAAEAGPAEAAAPRLRDVATGVMPALTDGHRFAVVDLSPPTASPLNLQILDSRTGGSRTLELTGLTPGQGPPPECVQTPPGADQLVWSCQASTTPPPPTSQASVARVELHTGRLYRVPGFDSLSGRYPQDAEFQLTAIGAFWLAGLGTRTSGQGADLFLIDWRNGRVRSRPRLTTRQVLDLGQGNPARRLCAPLRRRDSAVHAYEYDPPFGLAQSRSGAAGPVTLRLDRCGRRGRRVIARCQCTATLGDGAISWIDGAVAHVYLAASGRHLRWHLPTGGAQIAHTAYAVYVSLPPPYPGGAWRILSARLP